MFYNRHVDYDIFLLELFHNSNSLGINLGIIIAM